MNLSLTEENYLKSIYSINLLNGGKGAGTNELSAQLNNKAASVTDMLKRLAAKKVIRYERYKNAFPTAKGEKLALSIIRRHRLWEVFLTQKLKFSWDEVHDIAEQLEHVQSDELIARLDRYLGKPKFDPHGDPIPTAKGRLDKATSRPLNVFTEKGDFIFRGVTEHSGPFLRHLSAIGLSIGDVIHVESVNAFDGSMQVRLHKKSTFLSDKVTSNLLVIPRHG